MVLLIKTFEGESTLNPASFMLVDYLYLETFTGKGQNIA